MPVGDDAAAAGYSLVPGTDLVKNGATEMNRTRDFIAQVKALIPAVWPVSKGGTGGADAATARTNLGLKGVITISTAAPSGGADGDIWFKYTA
jgi:hypothetical protein